MGHLHLSLRVARHHAEKAHEAARAPRLILEFLDRHGAKLGGHLRPRIPEPLHVEVPNGEAGFDWHRPDPHLSVAARKVPDQAVTLRARAGLTLFAEMPLAAAAAAKPSKPADRRVFNPAGTWNLLLVSEHFTDKERFFAFAAQLDDHIRHHGPFSNRLVGDKLRVEALFWPSPPDGLFKTMQQGRLVYGDNDLVNRFLDKARANGRLTVVLVDLPVRGGAGGARGRPAWVTITSDPNETWQAVALHELGHSFGLADEYANADQPTPEPNPLEPNVTDKSDPAQAPWAVLCTPGHPGKPTCPATVAPPAPLGVVGTFEGARYKPTGRYRPTAECLMQRTDRTFCPVCEAAIARVLA